MNIIRKGIERSQECIKEGIGRIYKLIISPTAPYQTLRRNIKDLTTRFEEEEKAKKELKLQLTQTQNHLAQASLEYDRQRSIYEKQVEELKTKLGRLELTISVDDTAGNQIKELANELITQMEDNKELFAKYEELSSRYQQLVGRLPNPQYPRLAEPSE